MSSESYATEMEELRATAQAFARAYWELRTLVLERALDHGTLAEYESLSERYPFDPTKKEATPGPTLQVVTEESETSAQDELEVSSNAMG